MNNRNKKLSAAPPGKGDFRAALEREAKALGFADIGIAPAQLDDKAGERLQQWLADGCHGDMLWMETRADERIQPTALWRDVRSVIMLGMSYTPPHNPLDHLAHRDKGLISVYAQGGDYHKWVKKALKALARWIVENAEDYDVEDYEVAPERAVGPQARPRAGRSGRPSEAFGRERKQTPPSPSGEGLGVGDVHLNQHQLDTPSSHPLSQPSPLKAERALGLASGGASPHTPPPQIKVFVDTAPVMEKPLAQLSGLGWQGKHSNLVSQQDGSWLFLGAIYTDLDIAPDSPGADHCGSCTACQDICPTQAFTAPYKLDARKCISYLTIEHGGPIAHQYRAAMGNRVYGCDDCLAICPWNKFADSAQRNRAFLPRAEFVLPDLDALLALDKASFASIFAGSAIKRIGRERMVRNAAIAAGNSKSEYLAAPLKTLLNDESAAVRGAAIWALWQLAPDMAEQLRERHEPQETDKGVLAEWQRQCPSETAIALAAPPP